MAECRFESAIVIPFPVVVEPSLPVLLFHSEELAKGSMLFDYGSAHLTLGKPSIWNCPYAYDLKQSIAALIVTLFAAFPY